MPITREQAETLKHGTILEHATKKNADKTPMRARVTGKVRLWKRRPDYFELPVKHGLYDTGYIDTHNAHEWSVKS